MRMNIEKLEYRIHKEGEEIGEPDTEDIFISLSNITWEDFEELRKQILKIKDAKAS